MASNTIKISDLPVESADKGRMVVGVNDRNETVLLPRIREFVKSLL